ncbi:MAG TPA: antibiotic biosynthesis monooxygenase family protein [Dehalococcoidia bacterium]|nr:antibiotic biosynthesis monooxygenase family protein [Dehalococcoidia bacterium]
MNQVQEMLRLKSADKSDEAVLRLTGLFRMMSEQPGFIGAEVLRGINDPETLIVLHAWRDLEDWQTFQTSQPKLDFSASRPESLYSFVPCGMNWRSMQADGAREGALLRREVIRDESLGLRTASGIEGCQTYAYVDDEPAQYRGCTLRLTRLSGPQAEAAPAPESEVLVDELYESLMTIRAPGVTVS